MFKVAIIYILLIASMAGPPLLLVTIPLTFIITRSYLRQRRKTVDLATAIAAEKNNDMVVRYFR